MSANPQTVRIEFDVDEVGGLSLDLLKLLEMEQVDVQTAGLALALSFGRLLSPTQPMAEDDEVKFLQAIHEWAGMYFTEGEVQ